MTHTLIDFLTLLACLGCGLIAGVFFAFSSFVMGALARLPARQGVAAMQSINVVVLGPSFLGVFLGTAGVCLGTVAAALLRWPVTSSMYLLGGGLLYLIGCFLVTLRFNVPRNEALIRVGPDDPDLEARWTEYVVGWTWWNHVRTAASFAAAVAYAVALAR